MEPIVMTDLKGNMMRMVRRNLKICLALLPELSRLKERLGFRDRMSATERAAWKASHQEELSGKLKNILRRFKMPMYFMDFVQWLFLATPEDIAQVKAYVKDPRGTAPRASYYLFRPAFQFDTGLRIPVLGMLTDAGYRVAIMTAEEPGPRQYWSTQGPDDDREDVLTFSPELLRQMLPTSGDFVVRGNLDLFDARSWRRLGKYLAGVKKVRGMGKPLGLVAGRQKGASVRRKKVLQEMSWGEIEILVAEQPGRYNQLQTEYANLCGAQYVKEFMQNHQGQAPPPEERRKVRKNAILNFARHVKKPVSPKVKGPNKV